MTSAFANARSIRDDLRREAYRYYHNTFEREKDEIARMAEAVESFRLEYRGEPNYPPAIEVTQALAACRRSLREACDQLRVARKALPQP